MKRPGNEARTENTNVRKVAEVTSQVVEVLEAYIHDQAWKVSWRHAEEGRQITDSLKQSLEINEADISVLNDRVDALANQVNESTASMEVEVNDEVSEKLAQLEADTDNALSDLSDRMGALEHRLGVIIEAMTLIAKMD